MAQCVGDEWVNIAQNSTVWRSKLEEMINWKKTENVDRTCVEKE